MKKKEKKEAGLPFLNKYNCLESTAIQPNHFQQCSNRERKEKRKEKKTVAGIISSASPDVINIQTKRKEKEILRLGKRLFDLV